MTIDLATAAKHLQERKYELEKLSAISAEARETVTLDQQSVGRLSRMDAMQQQAMAEANERARANELLRIKAALTRVETGDYGYCLDCGNEIAERRLDVDASAALCVQCAGKT